MSKRHSIIEAAGKRFRYYGVAKTTMQEIAADAGVAVGTLYLVFKNKDDLIVACTDEFVDRHRREVSKILAADLPPDEKVRRYILGRFRAAEQTRTGSRHAAELTRAVLRLRPQRSQEEGLMMWETLVQILKQGVRGRLFHIRSVEDDAKVFLFSIAYFFPNALTEPPVPPRQEDLLAVINFFLKTWQGETRSRRRPRKPARHA